MRFLLACGLVLFWTDMILAARILAVLPLPSKSHYTVSSTVLQALADRGHEVVVFSPYPPSSPIKNLKHIEIHTDFEDQMKKMQSFEFFMELTGANSFWGLSGPLKFWEITYKISEQVLVHPKIKELLSSGQKFEVFMAEAMFGQESLLSIGHVLNAITIDINSFNMWSVTNRVFGNSLQISHQPETLADLPVTLCFVDRLKNFMSVTGTLIQYYYMHLPKHQKIVDRTMKGKKLPAIQDMVTKISLSLANFHPTLSNPRTIPPNIIPVGGMHILETPPPLPKEMKEFMDSGKNAVIYFSLGSAVPMHLMPQHYLQIFVRAFSKLPYKVLWKIESESIPNLPKNVMISKWVPQQSVLGHPNCVLFVTHGGILSQQEALHFGVPVVGIPFFGDQPHNVGVYEHLGVGVRLDFHSLTEQSLTKAILSVAGKAQFVENAKRVSTIFRHRPMSPQDSAVFWVEYAVRHDSAPHLRPRAAIMPLYQLWLLDIVGASLLLVLVSFLVLKAVVTAICCRRKQAAVHTSKKKN